MNEKLVKIIFDSVGWGGGEGSASGYTWPTAYIGSVQIYFSSLKM